MNNNLCITSALLSNAHYFQLTTLIKNLIHSITKLYHNNILITVFIFILISFCIHHSLAVLAPRCHTLIADFPLIGQNCKQNRIFSVHAIGLPFFLLL